MSDGDATWQLRQLLAAVQAGTIDLDNALAELQRRSPPTTPPAADLGFANVDHDRHRRTGQPEVVFCQGKRPDEAAAIAAEIHSRSGRVLMTRAEPQHFAAAQARLPDAQFHERARCITARGDEPNAVGNIAVVAAGTADLPVAEEAVVTAGFCGRSVQTHFDVGVAGLHRLLGRIDAIRKASCVIAVAGMEGALPSVLAGLLDRPVIAVPTSIGYGAHFGGLVPLLTMLNSCAAGVSVVNVDNGFGAGYLAAMIDQGHTDNPPQTPN